MELDALNKYLEATQDHLGVESQRYGGGFLAIVAHRATTDFLFDMLEGNDLQATEAMAFLGDNPLFPSATGKTPQEALQKLSAKLELLYSFEFVTSGYKGMAVRRFELKAQYEADPGEEPSWYDVSWFDVVDDLKSGSLYYYQDSKDSCSDSEKRNLHALNFKYEGLFADLLS
jgi:hypothetical protein